MSGKRYFLDTNAIIQLLKGNEQLVLLLHNADYIAASVISRLEFLSFSGLSDKDKYLYETFEKRISLIELSTQNMDLLNAIIAVRTSTTLKLPDSIISASANTYNCILLTADKKLLAQTQCESLGFESI